VLSAAVALTLLIACANVAGLLLARGAGRRQELAIRSALGATRSRLAGQLLAENLILAGTAAAVGSAAGLWLQRLVVVVADIGQPQTNGTSLPLAVLAFALGLAVATGLLFGLAPAMLVSKSGPASLLGRGSRVTASRGQLRHVLVTSQVALSITLLVAASLLVRSFLDLSRMPLGFEPKQVLAGTVDLPRMTRDQRVRFLQQLREDATRLPGVVSVGAVSHLPLRDAFDDLAAWVTGDRPGDGSKERTAHVRLCSPGYFRTLGIPLLSGRDLADSDRATTARVAVINQTMARQYFPGQDPIGRHVTVTSRPAPVDFEVVGVVGDARIDAVVMPAPVTLYVPMDQFWESRTEMSLVVRTALSPAVLSMEIGRIVASRNPNVPGEAFVPMDAVIGETLRLQRATTLLLGLLSATSLLLAALGLYGVLASQVAERTRELGIRITFGASPRALVHQVVAQSLTMVVPGLALGLAASRATSGLLARVLQDVHPAGLSAYAVAAGLLGMAAIVASAWPAHRAASLDPVEALRRE
jgi:putative ABC transport system permease protein